MKTVLIAEDSEFISDLLTDIFKEAGFSIAGVATTGREVVMMYEKYAPSLVTMDILMPEMDGLMAIEEIRKIDPDAKIIVISALLQDKLKKRAKDLGAITFVEKPFRIADIEKAIEMAGLQDD